MTCHSSRDEYIQSIRNVVEATRALTDMQHRFIEDLRREPSHSPPKNGLEEWQLCTDALSRLIEEQNSALSIFNAARDRHSSG